MKKILRLFALPLLFTVPAYSQALLQIGEPFTSDLGYDILFAKDGSFITCGYRGNNAILYKTNCAGAIVAEIEKQYTPGPGRFFDTVQLPDGSLVAAGSAIIALPSDTLERMVILKTSAGLSEIAVANFLLQNKSARAKSLALAPNGDLLVLGEVMGAFFDFNDMFLLRVDPNTLQPIGDPVIYNNGVDIAEEIIRTTDGNYLIAGSSFSGNVFDPNAVITNRLQAIKTSESGAVLWQYTYQDTFPAQFGLALAGGVEQNPALGNFMLSATTYGGTPEMHQDAFFILLDNNGNLLDTAIVNEPLRQGIFGTTGYSDIPGLYLAVGESDNPVLGYPNLLFVQHYELGGQIATTLANEVTSPFALSDVIEIGQNRLAILANIPDNPTVLASKNIAIATPQVDNIEILYQNCALVASFSTPNPTYQWYLNDLPIPGANAGVYYPDQSGTYRVQIVDSIGCFGFSDTLTVTLVTAGFEFNTNNLDVEFVNTSVGATSYTWDFGDGTIDVDGPVNPVHTYAAGGVYTVTMFAYSVCGVDTIIQTIGLVGAGEPSWLRQCQLFPNPNRGVFTVAITGVPQPELTFTLFNQTGQLVGRQNLDFKTGTLQHTLDFGSVAPGVYSLQVQAQGETKYLKVIATQ